jgi:hypothetical protein
MKKTLIAFAAAVLVAAGTITAPTPAQAGSRGGAIAAGVIGGLALGALATGALAGPRYYGGGPYYAYAPGPAYAYGPPCYWRRERIWTGWGWAIRRVRVCY